MSDTYPNRPGDRGVETSIEAGNNLAPDLARLQAKTQGAYNEAGATGLTVVEAAERINLDRYTVQARTSELRKKGLIADSGQRRPNPSGRRAIVWTLPEHVAPPPVQA